MAQTGHSATLPSLGGTGLAGPLADRHARAGCRRIRRPRRRWRGAKCAHGFAGRRRRHRNDGQAQETIEACEAAGLKCIPTGLAHGTVTVLAQGDAYEVTTLREDIETFGRRAKVAYTADWAADARRRDFTMNAFYCAADGTVSDPLGGWPDLVARRVRFIGNPTERIREDYLRILRFFRFQAEAGQGAPDGAALDACVRERQGLAILSAERVRGELIKLLSAADPLPGVGPMFDFGLLSVLLRAAPRPGLLSRLVAAEQGVSAPIDAILRLSALAVATVDDIPPLAERLRLSNAERDDLIVIDHNAATLEALSEPAARRALYRDGARQWQRRALAAAAAGAGARWRTLCAAPIMAAPTVPAARRRRAGPRDRAGAARWRATREPRGVVDREGLRGRRNGPAPAPCRDGALSRSRNDHSGAAPAKRVSLPR